MFGRREGVYLRHWNCQIISKMYSYLLKKTIISCHLINKYLNSFFPLFNLKNKILVKSKLDFVMTPSEFLSFLRIHVLKKNMEKGRKNLRSKFEISIFSPFTGISLFPLIILKNWFEKKKSE